MTSGVGLQDEVQTPFMQSGHSVCTVRQHSALVDRTFVCDLALVNGGGLGQQAHARNAVGAASGCFGQLIEDLLKLRQHGCTA